MNTISFPFLHEGLREINEEFDERLVGKIRQPA